MTTSAGSRKVPPHNRILQRHFAADADRFRRTARGVPALPTPRGRRGGAALAHYSYAPAPPASPTL